MRYLIQNEVIKDLEIAEGFKLIDLDDVKKNMYYISEDGKIYSTFLNDFLIILKVVEKFLKGVTLKVMTKKTLKTLSKE